LEIDQRAFQPSVYRGVRLASVEERGKGEQWIQKGENERSWRNGYSGHHQGKAIGVSMKKSIIIKKRGRGRKVVTGDSVKKSYVFDKGEGLITVL